MMRETHFNYNFSEPTGGGLPSPVPSRGSCGAPPTGTSASCGAVWEGAAFARHFLAQSSPNRLSRMSGRPRGPLAGCRLQRGELSRSADLSSSQPPSLASQTIPRVPQGNAAANANPKFGQAWARSLQFSHQMKGRRPRT